MFDQTRNDVHKMAAETINAYDSQVANLRSTHDVQSAVTKCPASLVGEGEDIKDGKTYEPCNNNVEVLQAEGSRESSAFSGCQALMVVGPRSIVPQGADAETSVVEVLQEEDGRESSTFSDGQAPAVVEPRSTVPQDTGAEISVTGGVQDCDDSMKSPKTNPKTNHDYTLATGVSIDRVTLFGDNRSPVITLKILNFLSGAAEYEEVSLDKLTKDALRKLATKHGCVSTNWKDLFNRLMAQIKFFRRYKANQIERGHIDLGWIKNADGIAYCHQHMISLGGQSSEYKGQVDIEPKGELANIVEMIDRWILSTSEWSPLEAIIAFSVGSNVLPYARLAWGENMNNLIIHLLGNSTSGKSTSLRLHAGLASNPFNENSGYWINHQTSLGAIIRRIGDNQGLPVSIDELSSAKKKEYSDFVYALGNGGEKDRLTAGGTKLCDAANFSTIILSSGEVSILRKCSANAGIRARCVEICNEKWTDSKEQAEAICDCLKDNYGWVAPLVAEELLNNSDWWKSRWDQISEKVKKQMDDEKIRIAIAPRISDFVVLFTLAAEIANKVLDIKLDVEKIFAFCYEHIIADNAAEANIGVRAYEFLLRYACTHRDEFSDTVHCEAMCGAYNLKKGELGFFRYAKRPREIHGLKYNYQLVLLKDAYEKLLEDHGFTARLVSHQLRDESFLQTKDKRRYTSKLTVNQAYVDCYILYTRQEEDAMIYTNYISKYTDEDYEQENWSEE